MIDFTLTGVEDALKRLARIDSVITESNLAEDALVALEPVVEDARALAPVGRGVLSDSIEAVQFEDGTVGVIIGDWKGHFFELGTLNLRAQPMLGPAMYANEGVVIEILGGRVAARIEGAL